MKPTNSAVPEVHMSLSAAEIEVLHARLHALVPGGCHTYAKGDDQFPADAPAFIVRGIGSHTWDAAGREYIEYGMGLRAVTLGHAFPPVVEAAAAALADGTNFSRPSLFELECAETFLRCVPTMQMVKFCKDGSNAVDGAIRLARAHTGRELVAICGDQPFFSTSDWFIGSTPMKAGIPSGVREQTLKFPYNDLAAVQELFDRHPRQIACVVLEAERIDAPRPSFLRSLRDLCHGQGALLVFDEMITGFRWHLGGAQAVHGVTPDLSAFGKAMANGFSVSALAGSREVMRLGGSAHDRDRVFLLSSTHGAEGHGLAAAIATMRFYESHPVVETLHTRGRRLREGFDRAVADHGLREHVELAGRDCSLLFVTRDADRRPSQAFRTLFLQQLIRRGVIAPSFVVSYSHTEADIDATVEAAHGALAAYRRALEDGVERHLDGRSVRPVFRRYA